MAEIVRKQHLELVKKVPVEYTKKTVLRAICMYSKWHYDMMSPNPRTQLFTLRMHYGTQFLIDMFVVSEEFINHFPSVAMHRARADIIFVLNNSPTYRLLYERN